MITIFGIAWINFIFKKPRISNMQFQCIDKNHFKFVKTNNRKYLHKFWQNWAKIVVKDKRIYGYSRSFKDLYQLQY